MLGYHSDLTSCTIHQRAIALEMEYKYIVLMMQEILSILVRSTQSIACIVALSRIVSTCEDWLLSWHDEHII